MSSLFLALSLSTVLSVPHAEQRHLADAMLSIYRSIIHAPHMSLVQYALCISKKISDTQHKYRRHAGIIVPQTKKHVFCQTLIYLCRLWPRKNAWVEPLLVEYPRCCSSFCVASFLHILWLARMPFRAALVVVFIILKTY